MLGIRCFRWHSWQYDYDMLDGGRREGRFRCLYGAWVRRRNNADEAAFCPIR